MTVNSRCRFKYEREILKTVENMNEDTTLQKQKGNGVLPCVMYCFLCGGELFMKDAWVKDTIVCKNCSNIFHITNLAFFIQSLIIIKN